MKITFQLQYKTSWGQRLYISGNTPEFGNWNIENAVAMTHEGEGEWSVSIETDNEEYPFIVYKYIVRDENTHSDSWEWGKNRRIVVSVYPEMVIRDFWRSYQWEANTWFSSAFTHAILKRETGKYSSNPHLTGTEVLVSFGLNAALIEPNQIFGIIGSDEALGNWDEEKVVLLEDDQYPTWETLVGIKKPNRPIHYKYVILDADTKTIIEWETGEDRELQLHLTETDTILYRQTDENFRYEKGWRGAGVAIPVFSLRSSAGGGVGEFPDIERLVDWAKITGLKLVQVLPINDTVATHTWTDSYPYAAISVFALHPMYINLGRMGRLKDMEIQAQFDTIAEQLNQLAQIDYEAVMKMKSRFFKLLYDQEKENFLKDNDFISFLSENKKWLKPYAVFSHLRDLFNTPDFSKWKIGSVFDWGEVEEMCGETDPNFDHIAVHYFIQYHAHKQLLAATNYARQNRIILKGDIPIGIYRYSVDAWMFPYLYNMDAQAGAPPDDFAVFGQNWGFPTYNWEEMAKDGYIWWKERLIKLSAYFDAFRIDHILGFFRIWQIPYSQIDGLLGVFNPTLALTSAELRNAGIYLNYERLCTPYIREYFLQDIFGEYTDEVKEEFLEHKGEGYFRLKSHVSTQREVEFHISLKEWENRKKEIIQSGLNELIREILFLEDSNNGLNPRISIQQTRSFKDLEPDQKDCVLQLYNHYFFERMNDFWKEKAMEKLPTLVRATDMLICGEDLGMIPASVPGVMKALNILSLEIQRMPKGDTEFGHLNDAPYLSVVSPSSHDMSTLRGWWEEDRSKTQRFFTEILLNHGEAPYYCEPWVIKQILEQHLHSPAMWSIFPIQDLVAADGILRREKPQEEQINVPANSKHYWRFRLHLSMEQLIAATEFNLMLKEMIEESER